MSAYTKTCDLVHTNRPIDVTELSPSCHLDDSNTQMMLHLLHAAHHDHSKAYLRTIDIDITSAMFGIGKKTTWNAWDTFPKLTEVIIAITETTASLKMVSPDMKCLERFTIVMYSKIVLQCQSIRQES